MAGNEVKIKINGDASGFKKTLSGLGSVAKSSLGAIVTGAGAAATAIGAVSVKALTLAGDLEQNVGGAEAVFGTLGKSIEKMSAPMQKYNAETKQVEKTTSTLAEVSKQAYQTMGLSQSDYLATINKMGSLMKGSGMETQEALNLSADAMQRAADVASIMGVDIEWAMESIAGAAKGNFTMMDNLGVAMNNTTLAAYALSKGIKKPFEKMSQSQKISLAMQMFMEKTAYAAGNYAKENETLAGSLATAKAAMSNFLSGAGDVDAVIDSFKNFITVVKRMGGELGQSLSKQLIENMDDIGSLISEVMGDIAVATPDIMNIAVNLVSALVSAITSNADIIASSGAEMVTSLITGITQMIPSLASAAIQVVGSFTSAIVTELPNILGQVLSMFGELISAIGDGVSNLDAASTAVLGFAAAFATLKISAAIAPALSAVGAVISGLTAPMGLATAAAVVQTKAVNALNAAWMANPFGIAIAAIVALGTAMVAGSKAYDSYIEKNSEAIQAAKAMGKAAEENAEKIKKLSKSVDENSKSFAESNENILAEAYAEEKLVQELYALSKQENLTTAQKQRMASIVGQLNSSIDGLNLKLDTETGKMNMTAEAVQKLIDKKKLLAQENAASSMYTEALEESYKIEVELEMNQDSIAEVESKIAEIEARGKTQTISIQGTTSTVTTYSREDTLLLQQYQEQLETLKTTQSELSESQEKNNNLIDKANEKWNEASVAVAQNSAETEKNATKTEEGNKKVEKSTKEATKAVKELGETKATPNIAEPVQAEVQQATSALEQGGQEGGAAYSKGVEEGATPPDLQTPVQEGGEGAVGAAEAKGSEIGSAFTASLEGTINGQPVSLTLTIDASSFTGMGATKGAEFITSASAGITAGAGQLTAAVSNTFQGAMVAAQGKKTTAVQTGEYIGQGFADGIRNKKSEAVNAAVELVEDAIEAANAKAQISSPSKRTTKSGQFMGEGYAVGLRKSTKGVVEASVDMVNASLDAMRKTADIHSPSGKGEEVGSYEGEGVAVGEIKSIPMVVNASKKLINASLDAMGDTVKSGIKPLNRVVEDAAKDIINLVPSPNAGVTNFVTEQLFGGDPIEQAKYFAKRDTKSALDAYAEAQKNELKKYEAAKKEGNYSEILWYQLEENMFPKTDDGVMAFFDQRIDILETMLDMEVITEQTYYERLQQYMGEYLVNGTEQWYEYTLKMMEHKSDLATQAMEDNVDNAERFAEFEQDVLDSAHDLTLFEEMDFYRERIKRYEGYIQDVLANTEMMEKDKKELIDDYESQITDDLYAYAEKYVDAYSDAAEKIRDKEQELTDDIIAARDNMMGNLADYGTLFFQYELPEINIGGIKHKPVITELSDIGKTNETKRKYKEMLDQVMAREGFAEGFFSELEGLSIADGIDFMGALLSASDTGFKKFMSAWAEGKALDKSISESFYDPSSIQNNPELQELRDAFTQEFGDLPDEFLTLGNQSADSFGNGLLGKITEIVNRAKNMVTSTFGNVLSPAFAMATEGVTSSVSYVSNYYLQASKYESMREQVKILRDADTLKKASGGY